MRILRIIVPALVFVLSTVCLLPASVGATSDCYHYVYSNDYTGNHYSLMKNNSILIGNELSIISNCDYSVQHDNSPKMFTEGNITITVPYDTSSFKLVMDNVSYHYTNLTFYPASEAIYHPNYIHDDNVATSEELFTNELLAHIVTFAILFFMSTNVVYRIAQSKIDNSIEVVI